MIMDLAALSLGELNKLKANIEKEISSRARKHRGKALEEIKSVAAKYGLKLDELVGKPKDPGTPSSARKPHKATKVARAKPVSTKSKAAVIRFRHPQNPDLTWSGGRGRRPQWVQDWEASGRTIEEARVAAA